MNLFKRQPTATYQAVDGPDSVRLTGSARSIRRALSEQPQGQAQPETKAGRKWGKR